MTSRGPRLFLIVSLFGPSAMGCTSADAGDVAVTSTSAPPARIEGAPSKGEAPSRITISIEGVPRVLSTLGGAAVIGTESGLYLGDLAGGTTLSAVPIVASGEEPEATGAVLAMARRTGDALLVAGERGLFHSAGSYLLPSPMSAAFDGQTLAMLDAFGSGETEEIWITTEAGLTRVAHGSATAVTIIDGSGAVDAAVAVAPDQALVARGGAVYLVDLGAGVATIVAEGLGTVTGFDRGEDGTVYLATQGGLLARTKAGATTLRTFAGPGAPARATTAVSAAFGALVAATDAGLVAIDADGAARLLEETVTTTAHGAVVDAAGDTWIIDDGALSRLSTGAPVSFEADVRPLATAHCMTCHAEGGSDGAPNHDFATYEVAKEFAQAMVDRLRDTGPKTMPPPNTEVLGAADIAVFTRWVATGTKP